MSKVIINPINDRIVLKQLDAETETEGGLIIPDGTAQKPRQAIVVAAGPGAKNVYGEIIPMKVKVGDWVLYSKYNTQDVKIDNEDYVVTNEDDIMAILKRVEE